MVSLRIQMYIKFHFSNSIVYHFLLNHMEEVGLDKKMAKGGGGWVDKNTTSLMMYILKCLSDVLYMR